jgi:hypothetical protein
MPDPDLHPTELEAEANFARLPKDAQERIRSEGDAIGQRVISHVVQILIGRPGGRAKAEEANHASGVVALVGARPVFFTAQHVLAKYRLRLAAESDVVFQIGNVSFDRVAVYPDSTRHFGERSLTSQGRVVGWKRIGGERMGAGAQVSSSCRMPSNDASLSRAKARSFSRVIGRFRQSWR